jgi:formyltetrahydrofolate deformylase
MVSVLPVLNPEPRTLIPPMQIVITAVGPDNVRLADPIIHYVTGQGANIAEIQMYDHDEEALFAMLLRISLPAEQLAEIRHALIEIGKLKNLGIRVWSPEERAARPRLAILATYRPETPLALLRAIRDGQIKAEPAVMIGNRPACRGLAEQFSVPWEMIGDAEGRADDEALIALLDQYNIDYVILARYMRVLPPASCWKYAGGRIINLHHGLLPSFPGPRPYHDAYASRMLTYGATCHFIVPELDAGNQIIYQSTYTVPPGMKLDEIIRLGQEDNEPRCLVEGVRRVVDREVQLHFHRVVARR